jgi:hypothetical protein
MTRPALSSIIHGAGLAGLSFALAVGCSSGPGKGNHNPDGGGSDGGFDGGSGGGDDGGDPNAYDGGLPIPDGMLTGNGCAGGTCLNKDCKPLGTAVTGDSTPSLEFGYQPMYIPKDVIIPTLDDVPDSGMDPTTPQYGAGHWTLKDLDYLYKLNMHLDLFINTNNWCDVSDPTNTDCIQAVQEVLAYHNPGNHTIHHIHMGGPNDPNNPGCPDATTCTPELDGVESLINTLSLGGRPHLTRFRAPYGDPFVPGSPFASAASWAAPLIAKYAVHVGWNIDDGDSMDCGATGQPACPDGNAILSNVKTAIEQQGAYGILLMHGTYPWTHDALPLLFDPQTGYLTTQKKFRIGTVEDAICWKYGKHSWQLIQDLNGTTRGPN